MNKIPILFCMFLLILSSFTTAQTYETNENFTYTSPSLGSMTFNYPGFKNITNVSNSVYIWNGTVGVNYTLSAGESWALYQDPTTCVMPYDGQNISSNYIGCYGQYYFYDADQNGALFIGYSDNLNVNGNNMIIIGNFSNSIGIKISTRANITISNFTFKKWTYGIRDTNTAGTKPLLIKNSKFINNSVGIYLERDAKSIDSCHFESNSADAIRFNGASADNNNISNSFFVDNEDDIHIGATSGTGIENCRIINNTFSDGRGIKHGVYLEVTTNCIIDGNSFLNRKSGIQGETYNYGTIIRNNYIYNSTLPNGTAEDAIKFINKVVSFSIYNNTIIKTGQGIFVANISNSSIFENTINEAKLCLYLELIQGNNIYNNKISNCSNKVMSIKTFAVDDTLFMNKIYNNSLNNNIEEIISAIRINSFNFTNNIFNQSIGLINLSALPIYNAIFYQNDNVHYLLLLTDDRSINFSYSGIKDFNLTNFTVTINSLTPPYNDIRINGVVSALNQPNYSITLNPGDLVEVSDFTYCGDGIVQSPNDNSSFMEDCDGANLNSQTCLSVGFTKGTLSCNSCSFVTTDCQAKSQSCQDNLVPLSGMATWLGLLVTIICIAFVFILFTNNSINLKLEGDAFYATILIVISVGFLLGVGILILSNLC